MDWFLHDKYLRHERVKWESKNGKKLQQMKIPSQHKSEWVLVINTCKGAPPKLSSILMVIAAAVPCSSAVLSLPCSLYENALNRNTSQKKVPRSLMVKVN